MGSILFLMTVRNPLIRLKIKAPSTITVVCQVAVLLLYWCNQTSYLFIRFVDEDIVSAHPYQEFGLKFFEDSFILSGFCKPDLVFLWSSIHLIIAYFTTLYNSIITVRNKTGKILCLLRLMWTVYLFFTFYLLMPFSSIY